MSMPARLALVFTVCLGLIGLAGPAAVEAGAVEEIISHTKQGKPVFVVVTDAAAKDLDAARSVAATASRRVKGSVVVELNRSDPTQAASVKKLRVAGAPTPLVLVIAQNGIPVGAARPGAKGAVDRLVGLVPSQGKAAYLKALSDKRVACVVFTRKGMKELPELERQLAAAAITPNIVMRTIRIDLDDTREKSFIADWKLDASKVTRPYLVFVNPKGQIVSRLQGAPAASRIVEASTKKVVGCGCDDPNCKGHG